MLNSLLPLLPPVQNCLVVLRASEETVRGERVWSCLPLFNAVPLGYLNIGKKKCESRGFAGWNTRLPPFAKLFLKTVIDT
jgi:hypothetical protein